MIFGFRATPAFPRRGQDVGYATDDEVACVAGAGSNATRQRRVAALFCSQEPQEVHASAAVCQQFFKTDYRGIVTIRSDMSDRRDELGLDQVPHYATLCYAEQRLLKKGGFESLLAAVFQRAQRLRLIDRRTEAAIDSSGASFTALCVAGPMAADSSGRVGPN
jgi:hypothetical protein